MKPATNWLADSATMKGILESREVFSCALEDSPRDDNHAFIASDRDPQSIALESGTGNDFPDDGDVTALNLPNPRAILATAAHACTQDPN